jgi:hypothetical protein
MITKQVVLAGFAAIVFGVGAAHAGPCNTGGKDAGSGPTPGYTGQTTTGTSSAKTDQHPPHRRMLRDSSRASPPPHSRPRGPSRQQRWPIKVAEPKGVPSAQAGGLPNVVRMDQA